MSVCKTVIPHCHIDTGSGTVNKLISEELIGKYQCHFRKERGKADEKKDKVLTSIYHKVQGHCNLDLRPVAFKISRDHLHPKMNVCHIWQT